MTVVMVINTMIVITHISPSLSRHFYTPPSPPPPN